jgi:hypothetical protein
VVNEDETTIEGWRVHNALKACSSGKHAIDDVRDAIKRRDPNGVAYCLKEVRELLVAIERQVGIQQDWPGRGRAAELERVR